MHMRTRRSIVSVDTLTVNQASDFFGQFFFTHVVQLLSLGQERDQVGQPPLIFLAEPKIQGFSPVSSSRSFRFLPVVVLTSLPAMLAMTDTSWQGDTLRLLKKLAYLAKISTLLEERPAASTF